MAVTIGMTVDRELDLGAIAAIAKDATANDDEDVPDDVAWDACAGYIPALIARVRVLEEYGERWRSAAEKMGQLVAKLETRVRELEDKLSEQSETVQREWLSPIEKEGWALEIKRLELLTGTLVSKIAELQARVREMKPEQDGATERQRCLEIAKRWEDWFKHMAETEGESYWLHKASGAEHIRREIEAEPEPA